MKIAPLVLACAAAAQWSSPAVAQASQWRRIELPPAVAVREEIRATPEGWQAAEDNRQRILASATFFDGRPQDMASLVYDREVKRKEKVTRIWRFDAGWKNGVWLQLGYAGTAVVLARQLPHGTTACRVEYDRSVTVEGYEQIQSIECH